MPAGSSADPTNFDLRCQRVAEFLRARYERGETETNISEIEGLLIVDFGEAANAGVVVEEMFRLGYLDYSNTFIRRWRMPPGMGDRNGFRIQSTVVHEVEHSGQQVTKSEASRAIAKPLRKKDGKLPSIDDRMKLLLFNKPESNGWTVSQFVAELKCSRSGVADTATWKMLEAARKLGKAERRKDRRRRGKSV